MAMTSATMIRMRARGVVKFEINYGEGDNISTHVVNFMQKQLERLSQMEQPKNNERLDTSNIVTE